MKLPLQYYGVKQKKVQSAYVQKEMNATKVTGSVSIVDWWDFR